MCACLAATHSPGYGRGRCVMSKLRLKATGSSSNELSTPGSSPEKSTGANINPGFAAGHKRQTHLRMFLARIHNKATESQSVRSVDSLTRGEEYVPIILAQPRRVGLENGMQRQRISRRAMIAGAGAICTISTQIRAVSAETSAAETGRSAKPSAPSIDAAVALLTAALQIERGGEWWALINYDAGLVAVSRSSRSTTPCV